MGLSLVSPKQGRVAGMGPTALKRTPGWHTNPGAAPNLPQAGSKPSGQEPCATSATQGPGHSGDSLGQVAQPGLAAGPPRGAAAAAQGLARSPGDIFIQAFVLFEAVSSVFSVLNTALPCPGADSDSNTPSCHSPSPWLPRDGPGVTLRWPWDIRAHRGHVPKPPNCSGNGCSTHLCPPGRQEGPAGAQGRMFQSAPSGF